MDINTILKAKIFDRSSTDIEVLALANILGGKSSLELATATGPIVSVSDAVARNAEKLIIGITPVQDLHGYDAPWPAGGGKNLFDKDTAVDGFIDYSGAAISAPDAENMTSDFIPVTAGSQYTYTQWPSQVGVGYWIGCGFYAEKDMSTVIGGRQTTSALVGMFTAPEGANYMRIGSRFLKNGKAQLEKGAVSTDYVPYSNICPITGWTGANVSRTGKNLLPNPLRYSSNGALAKTDAVFLKAGTYTVGFDSVSEGSSWRFFAKCFNSDGTVLYTGNELTGIASRENMSGYLTSANTTDKSVTITLPHDTFIAFAMMFGDISAESIFSGSQLELGSTATEYEPYSGSTLSISWQSEAGTVYGGTLDVTTGVLTVDRAMVTVNGTENVTWYINSGSLTQTVYTSPSLLPDVKITGGCQQKASCNEFDIIHSSAERAIGSAYVDNGYLNMVFTLGTFVTSDDVKTWLASNNVQVVYELATPVTYQLTPQEVALLRGTNNVWADTADTELTYWRKRRSGLLEMTSENLSIGKYIDDEGAEQTSASNFYYNKPVEVGEKDTITLECSESLGQVSIMEYDDETFVKRTVYGSGSSSPAGNTVVHIVGATTTRILWGANPTGTNISAAQVYAWNWKLTKRTNNLLNLKSPEPGYYINASGEKNADPTSQIITSKALEPGEHYVLSFVCGAGGNKRVHAFSTKDAWSRQLKNFGLGISNIGTLYDGQWQLSTSDGGEHFIKFSCSRQEEHICLVPRSLES